MVKKLPFLLLVAAPYFVPMQSKANFIGDFLRGIFGHERNHREMIHPVATSRPGTASGNAVPLDGGMVFLLAAGLCLGAKMLYDAKAQKRVASGL